VHGDEDLLSSGCRTELFVVVREGLRNALAHSQATSVAARIDITEATVTAMVEDDGIGLSETAAGNPASFGLASMRERAEMLGAELKVIRLPDTGTRLFLRMPIAGEAHGRAG
jgi:signal transduction histidine kinase